jgi:anti-sigma28 factor (negative regulator of flagellin synthesis)
VKITNHGVSQPCVNNAQQLAGAASSAQDTQAAETSAEADAFTPSAEWVRLVALAKQEPEIRADRVSAVLERLQNGDYFSDASAAATADALVNSLD